MILHLCLVFTLRETHRSERTAAGEAGHPGEGHLSRPAFEPAQHVSHKPMEKRLSSYFNSFVSWNAEQSPPKRSPLTLQQRIPHPKGKHPV